MSYQDKYGRFFGHVNDDGDVVVMYEDDGSPATRMDVSLYAVDSDGTTSVRYEHPEGIVISRADAEDIGLDIDA